MPILLTQYPWRASSRALRFVISATLQGVSGYIVPYDYLQSLTIKLLMGGGFTGTIAFLDRYGDLFTGAVISPNAQNYFSIQWDWAHSAAYPQLTIDNQAETYYTPTFNAAAMKPTPNLGRSGVSVTFDLVQTVVSQPFINKSNGPRQFAGGLKASDIVVQIAKFWGWTYIVEPTVDLLSEMTMGSETHMEFINQKLAPYARNKNNEHPYIFYFDTFDVMHFHSATYNLGPQGDATNVITNTNTQGAYPYLNWKFLYGFDFTGDVLEFTPTDDTLLMGQDGATDMTILAVNSNDGTATEYKSKADSPPNLNDGSPSTGVGSRWHPDEAAVTNPRFNNNVEDQNYHLVKARSASEILGSIVASHMHARGNLFKAEQRIMGNHFLNIGDYVSIRGQDFQHFDVYTSGVFLVTGIEHTVDSTGWHTKHELVRKGSPLVTGAPQLPVQSVNGNNITDNNDFQLGITPPNYGSQT